MLPHDTGPGQSYVCPQCQGGSLRLQRVLYAQWHSGQFITMPNFPAWVCDICGQREYDAAAVEQLSLLLGPAADPQPSGSRQPGHGLPSPDFDPDPRPSGRRRV